MNYWVLEKLCLLVPYHHFTQKPWASPETPPAEPQRRIPVFVKLLWGPGAAERECGSRFDTMWRSICHLLRSLFSSDLVKQLSCLVPMGHWDCGFKTQQKTGTGYWATMGISLLSKSKPLVSWKLQLADRTTRCSDLSIIIRRMIDCDKLS